MGLFSNWRGQRRGPARVLYLEHNVDGTIGGSHVCLLELCRTLDRSRFEPIVWFYQDNPLVEDFRAARVQVIIDHPLRTIPRYRRLRNSRFFAFRRIAQFLRLVHSVRRFAQRLRALAPDLVHLNNSCGDDQEMMLAAHLLEIPVVAHQRGMPPPFSRPIRWIANRIDRVIAVSGAVREHIVAQGVRRETVDVIHDGIDPGRARTSLEEGALREKLGLAGRGPVIGVVGNVKAWKGQATLVRAMGRVARVFPDSVCVLVGSLVDAEYVARLRELVASLGLERHILLAGFQRNPVDWMAAMDVVVHTSVQPEPFGLVIIEAMALRKPVIASDHGGPREIVIDGETGYLTAPHDADALATRLEQLLADRELRQRMGVAGGMRMAAQFTARANAERIERIYESLLGLEPTRSYSVTESCSKTGA